MAQFKIMFDNAKLMKNAIESITSIITEGILKITQEGIKISAMDGSHICLIDLFIDKSECLEYSFNCMDEISLGLNFDDCNKIFKRSKVEQKNYISLTFESSKKQVQISLINRVKTIVDLTEEERSLLPKRSQTKTKTIESMGDKSRDFIVTLIDLDQEAIDTSSLRDIKKDMDCKFALNASEFEDIVNDGMIYSEVLEFHAKNEVNFSSNGTMGNYNSKYQISQLDYLEIKHRSCGNFAIQFLKNILKSKDLGIDSNYHFMLKSDSPLSIEVKISEKSYIQYFLAPRVEENSDSNDCEEEEISTSIQHSNDEISSIHNEVVIPKPITINATIMMSQMSIGKEIDSLEQKYLELNEFYMKAAGFNNIQNSIMDQMKEIDNRKNQLEYSFEIPFN